jgi:hypothetical protein
VEGPPEAGLGNRSSSFADLPFQHRRNSRAADDDAPAFARHFDRITEVGA